MERLDEILHGYLKRAVPRGGTIYRSTIRTVQGLHLGNNRNRLELNGATTTEHFFRFSLGLNKLFSVDEKRSKFLAPKIGNKAKLFYQRDRIELPDELVHAVW